MTIKYIKLLLASLLAFSTMSLLPVCPEMEVWTDGNNYRYLIKDHHIDYVDGRISIKQQADIIWAAKQKLAQTVFVIAEDANSYPGNNKKIQEFYQSQIAKTIEHDVASTQAYTKIDPIKAQGSLNMVTNISPLACLIHACKSHMIPHYNVECNQGFDLYTQKYKIDSSLKLTEQDIISELSQNIAEVIQLPGFYTNLCKQLDELKQIALVNKQDQFIRLANEIRSTLVDVKTIKKLWDLKFIQHGFICAGELHITNIKDGLKSLGYKAIKSFGNADIWQLLYYSNQSIATIERQLLKNALDLKKTFQEIFQAQDEQETINASLKNPDCDIAFLQSPQGQQYLAEAEDTPMKMSLPNAKQAAELSTLTHVYMSNK